MRGGDDFQHLSLAAQAKRGFAGPEEAMSVKQLVVCGVLGLSLLALVVAVQGISLWTVLLALVLLVCPLVGMWVMRQMREPAQRKD